MLHAPAAVTDQENEKISDLSLPFLVDNEKMPADDFPPLEQVQATRSERMLGVNSCNHSGVGLIVMMGAACGKLRSGLATLI